MKGVPGVMALESQASLASEVISLPIAEPKSERTLTSQGGFDVPFHSASASKRASYFSRASWAERNRRDRCWFIFALGATPSTENR